MIKLFLHFCIFVGRVTDSSSQAAWTATGHQAEASSTTTPRHSSCGSTRRTSWESSPCSQVPTSLQFSTDSAERPSTLRPSSSSPAMTTSATSPHAQRTSAQPWEHPCTSSCQSWWLTKRPSIELLTSTKSKLEEFMASTPRPTTAFSTFRIREDLESPRNNLSRTWLTASRPSWRRKRHCDEEW